MKKPEPADPARASLEDLYGDAGMSEEQVEQLLDRSLHPRGPDLLFDLAGELGLGQGGLVLDVGCRNARHLMELARRYGCRGVGIEPVRANLVRGRSDFERAREEEPTVAGRVSLVQGVIEALPFPDATFDLVWARDMLIHLPDLRLGLGECGRVLRESGRVLVFQMFATPWLEPDEAGRLWPPLSANPDNADPEHFERAVAAAGLVILRREELLGEWREHGEEGGGGRTSRQLLWVSRLLRARDRFIRELGVGEYRSTLADSLWGSTR